jgi:hypothetical protein
MVLYLFTWHGKHAEVPTANTNMFHGLTTHFLFCVFNILSPCVADLHKICISSNVNNLPKFSSSEANTENIVETDHLFLTYGPKSSHVNTLCLLCITTKQVFSVQSQ